MEIEKQAFTGLMEYYKLLPLKNKRDEIISELESLISNYSKICTKLNVIPDMVLNKEMLNINRDDLSEDEFLNAIFCYLNTLQDISGQFIDNVCNLIENKN